MSEKRFEARGPGNSGDWAISDNVRDSIRSALSYFAGNYPGGPQAAAEAEAARLNAWWEAEQAKKAWRFTAGSHRVVDSAGVRRIMCYDGHCNIDPALAERVCRLLNEDDARREGREAK